MAIMLYKKGDSATVRGVKCDFIRCSIDAKAQYLSMGYVDNVNALIEQPAPETKTPEHNKSVPSPPSYNATNDHLATMDIAALKGEELRKMAEKFGLDNTAKAKFKTLRRKLEEIKASGFES